MGIKVTSARFMVDRQTYAMSGITSVKTEVEHPSKLGPYVTITFGVIGVFNGLADPSARGVAAMGLIVLAVGVLWLRSKRSEYMVLLTSASGETKAYDRRRRSLRREKSYGRSTTRSCIEVDLVPHSGCKRKG